jgi:aldehyde:ferredoxin oxidoreductase
MSWAGTILRVNLTDGKIEKEPTSRYVKDYIGNAGIAARIFWEEVPPDTRAYDPRNLLLFNTGPLTGTLFGNKATVAAKTPERANHPYAFVGLGGQFPSEIKFAGYDHIAIKGKAEGPVYLFIDNDNVEIRDARYLWGLDTHETQRMIKEELRDPEVQIACIGPAGENLVVYALILHDIDNTASRKVGAVMGSKKLKAVAVRGTKGLKVADPKALLALYDEFYDDFAKGRAAPFGKMQNTEGISRQIAEGYQYAYGAEIPEEVPPSPMIEFLKKTMVGPMGCAFCPLQCHQNFRVPGIGNGATTCVNYFGLIYQKMYDSTDFGLWWERTMLANRYGVDSLSVEMLGSWLMELYRRGIITADDTDGIPMERGSREAITSLIEKLAKGEGFGKLLIDGIVPAAQKIGKGSLKFADQYDNAFPYAWVDYAPDLGPVAKYRTGEVERVPGFGDGYGNIPAFAEILGVSPRKVKEMIDEFCCDASERITGDRNLWRTPKYNKKTSVIVIEKENEVLLGDITGHCEVTSSYLEHYGVKFGVEHYAQWLSAATGNKYTPEELRKAAHKTRTLVDAYNVLCALMIGEKPVVSIPIESLTVFPQPGRPTDPEELKKVQDDYCRMRGYDPETGIPTREELEKLGLKDVADKLESVSRTIPVGKNASKHSPESKKQQHSA